MSSILKALRKIEEEKRVASHAAPDLRVDQGGTPMKEGSFLPFLISGGLLAVACFALLSFWLFAKDPEALVDSRPEPPVTVVSSQQEQQTPAVTQIEKGAGTSSPEVSSYAASLSEQPVNVQGQVTSESAIVSNKGSVASQQPQSVVASDPRVIIDASTVASEAQSASLNNRRTESVIDPNENLAVSSQIDPVVANKPENLPEKKRSQEIREATEAKVEPLNVEKQVAAVNKVATVPVADEIVPKTPSLLPEGVSIKVAEIFYQEESDRSIALVNDLPVMVGTYVDSAVVLEIRPDTVLFKIEDKTYVVGVTPPE